jgi:hypothetical protein
MIVELAPATDRVVIPVIEPAFTTPPLKVSETVSIPLRTGVVVAVVRVADKLSAVPAESTMLSAAVRFEPIT